MILPSVTEAETAREMVSKCGQTFAAAAVDGEAVTIPQTDSAGWCWGAFAKRHPEQMNREFTDVALGSLVEAYPCR
jgi:hypothetical protein